MVFTSDWDNLSMSNQARYCINGRFLTRQITGVDRYAREIVRELDALVGKGEAVLLLPEGCEPIDWEPCKNIEVRHCGKHGGHAWEQLDLSRYARKNGLLAVNLCNTAPVINPGVVCIHDMAVMANSANYSRKFVVWYRFLFSRITRRAVAILTDSEFSKSEIERYYPRAIGKVSVIPCAWQHMDEVAADPEALKKYGLIRRGYWFAMSSLAPNKNLRWLVETALLNPDETIAIAGGINAKIFGEHDNPQAHNVRYLGYVSDEEAKALMGACKGFLFPTFYEGFGIPPMEAMAAGAPVVAVSDTEVMHEVYGDEVTYVDPAEPLRDLCKIAGAVPEGDVLMRYSWRSSAEQVLERLRRIQS